MKWENWKNLLKNEKENIYISRTDAYNFRKNHAVNFEFFIYVLIDF